MAAARSSQVLCDQEGTGTRRRSSCEEFQQKTHPGRLVSLPAGAAAPCRGSPRQVANTARAPGPFQRLSWSTPPGSGIPSSQFWRPPEAAPTLNQPFPSEAATGRLRASRVLGRSPAPASEAGGQGHAPPLQRAPLSPARGGGAGGVRHRPQRARGRGLGCGWGGPVHIRATSGGRGRGGRGRGAGSGGGRCAGAAARPIAAALSSVQTGAQWSERRARCSQAWRGRCAADGPARQWAPARSGGQPMGAGRGRARARLGCPCRVLG